MAPSVMIHIMKFAILQNTYNTIATSSLPSPAAMPMSRGALGSDTPREFPGAFSSDGPGRLKQIMVGKQIYGMNDYIPNTLSTTAHIQTLLFQP